MKTLFEDLNKKNNKIIHIIALLYCFGQKAKKNQLDIYSGAATFFLFVSLIPFAMLLLSIIPYTPITDEDLFAVISVIIPTKADGIALELMKQLTISSIATLSVSALGAIWLAAWGLQSLKKGLNKIYGVDSNKNFLLLRLVAILYTLVFIILIITIFIVAIFSERIFGVIEKQLARFQLFSVHSLVTGVFNIRFIILITLTFITCLLLFWIMPDKRLKLRLQIPGAVFVSLVWCFFSKLFNIYVDEFNAYSMYGSLSFLIIFLMWLYMSMYIFFIGAQINYYLSETVKKDKI